MSGSGRRFAPARRSRYEDRMWLNQRTVDAIRIMTALAVAHPRLTKAALLSERTGITPLNVQKTANILVQAGLIDAVRGPQGGLRLPREPAMLTVGEIARAFEPEDCPVNFLSVTPAEARISTLMFRAHREFFRPLEATTLADLAGREG